MNDKQRKSAGLLPLRRYGRFLAAVVLLAAMALLVYCGDHLFASADGSRTSNAALVVSIPGWMASIAKNVVGFALVLGAGAFAWSALVIADSQKYVQRDQNDSRSPQSGQ